MWNKVESQDKGGARMALTCAALCPYNFHFDYAAGVPNYLSHIQLFNF